MRTDTPAGGSWSSCPGALPLVALPHLPAEGEGTRKTVPTRFDGRGLEGAQFIFVPRLLSGPHLPTWIPATAFSLVTLPLSCAPVLGYHGLGASLWYRALALPGVNPLDGVENIGAGGSPAGSAAAILSPRQEPAGKGGVWESSRGCGYKCVCWSWVRGASRLALLSLQTCSGVRGLNSSHLPRLRAGTTASELAHIVLCLSFPLSYTRRT